jgi:hypothetical protein
MKSSDGHNRNKRVEVGELRYIWMSWSGRYGTQMLACGRQPPLYYREQEARGLPPCAAQSADDPPNIIVVIRLSFDQQRKSSAAVGSPSRVVSGARNSLKSGRPLSAGP